MGPTFAENPHSRTMCVARSVALARSFDAPVDGSLSTTISAARPPRRAAADADRERRGQAAPGAQVALERWHLPGPPEGGAAGEDGDLRDRIGLLGQPR